jgi:hypothetical protein
MNEETRVPDLFLQPQHISVTADGLLYVPRIYGDERADGTWEGWIEFHPVGAGEIRATDRETTQPNRRALEYWATGLEPVYYEGAFARAVVLPA